MDIAQNYILAVETSSRTGSAAVGFGSEMLSQSQFSSTAKHGVELIPTVDRLLAEAGISASDISVICISSGPGSFTGLRVGFSFARAYSQVSGAKLVQVPSTDVIIGNLKPALSKCSGTIYIAPVIDAKRKQVFSAGYSWRDGLTEKILDDGVFFPSDLMENLGRPLWVTGEGLEFHKDAFICDGVKIIDSNYWVSRAENVLKLGCRLAVNDKFVSVDRCIPNYIRLPEAEERWRMKQK